VPAAHGVGDSLEATETAVERSRSFAVPLVETNHDR
jgi:hypothetical protein